MSNLDGDGTTKWPSRYETTSLQSSNTETNKLSGPNGKTNQRFKTDQRIRAETDEEVDALRVNLEQDDEIGTTRDGTGRVVDDLAKQKIASFTEVGLMAGERGGASIAPGRDDASRILRRHHPNTEIARAEDVVEGNLDELQDEDAIERKVDEGTAA